MFASANHVLFVVEGKPIDFEKHSRNKRDTRSIVTLPFASTVLCGKVGELLEAGIEIYEYNRTMLHQKTMVVDGSWITIGTTNFDNRSFALHEESNVCIYDTRLAGRLEQIFFEDLSDCVRVNLESWKRRGMLTKIRGAAALFLKDQL